MPTDDRTEARERALGLLRGGLGNHETSRRTGVPTSTLSRWAKAAGIAAAGVAQVEAACAGTQLKWAQRRATLADEFGDTIGRLLGRIDDTTDTGDVKNLAVSIAVFVDKAQLVSGEATSRHEQLDAQRRRERVAALTDELEERRAAKDGTTGG